MPLDWDTLVDWIPSRDVAYMPRFDMRNRNADQRDGACFQATRKHPGAHVPRAACRFLTSVRVCRDFGAPVQVRGKRDMLSLPETVRTDWVHA